MVNVCTTLYGLANRIAKMGNTVLK